MDYEAWRCCHNDKWFCPDEGCSKQDGCARERGWHDPKRGGKLEDFPNRAKQQGKT